MVRQWRKDNLPQSHNLWIKSTFATNSDNWEAEITLHEDNCNVIFIHILMASRDFVAAKNPTALNVWVCICVCVHVHVSVCTCMFLGAGGVINNKREGYVSLRQAHKWWPGHHLLHWEVAGCSSSFPWRVKPAIEVWMGCHGRLHCTAVPLPWKLSYAPCQQVLCFPLSVSFSVSHPCPSPFLRDLSSYSLNCRGLSKAQKCTASWGFWR